MIVRIVRMFFKPEGVDEFLEIFERTKAAIRNVDGCEHLELLRDMADPDCYITVSHWSTLEALNQYRKTELFKNVWYRVKALFLKDAEVLSMEKFIEV